MASWEHQTIDSGRYRVLRKLARGGFGEVYLARDDKLDRDVVLKTPRLSWLEEPDFAERYRREIQALIHLRHPHVVPVYDNGEHEGRPFTVMEYLAGGTLADRLEPDAAGSRDARAAELRNWLPQVAAALDFMHRRGYVHRDVKPSNIVFDDAGQPYLTDFGIAKIVSETQRSRGPKSLTSTGVLTGTPQFMAPEMCLGHPLDGRCDQYALGVIAYLALSGELPIDGPTPMATVTLLVTREPRPLAERVPGLPRELSAAVHRALAKSPEKRFESCADFARAVLEAIDAGEPALAASAAVRSATARLVDAADAATGGPPLSGASSRSGRTQGDPRRPPRTAAAAAHTDTWKTTASDTRTARLPPRRRTLSRRWMLAAAGTALAACGLVVAGAAGLLSPRESGPQVAGAAAADHGSATATPFDPDTSGVRPRRPNFGDQIPGIRRLQGHTGDVFGLAWSPDGTRIASGGGDHTVRIWDVATDAELRRLEGHTERVRGVCFSPDGKRVASCGQDSTVRVWDAESGDALHVLRGHADYVFAVAFAADGRSLFSCGMDAAVREWDAATGAERRVLEGHLSWVRGLARSPDGTRLISGGNDGAFIVWDVNSGDPLRFVRGHTAPVASVTFVPHTQLAATAGYDQVIRVWDVAEWKPLHALAGHATTIREVAASPDGRLLASVAEDETLRLWDLASGKQVHVIDAPPGFGTVAFAPDGRSLATGGVDGTVEIWALPPQLLASAAAP
ncbi:MAG: serine/threonine-protein kinase [Planctomycetales bacterium]